MQLLVPLICSLFLTLHLAVSPLPHIENWREIQRTNYEFKIEGEKIIYTAYVGFEIRYQNPENPKEFVQVIKKFTPIISTQKIYIEGGESPNKIVSSYNKKEEQEKLQKRYTESDPIVYIKYHLAKDAHTQENILSGEVENWILNQEGIWVYEKGELLHKILLSESADFAVKKNVVTGIKFSIGNNYHILKIYQKDLLFEFSSGAGGGI